MTRLRIAFLTELFYPHVGGCETRYLEIGRRLVAKGHEVHVYTVQYDLSLAKEDQIDGMHIHRYAHSKKYISPDGFRSFRGILKYSFATLKKLKGSKFDVYYSNQWPMLHSIVAKPVTSPLVQEWCEVWDDLLKVKIMQKMLRYFGDYNVAVSEFTQQRLINYLKIKAEKTVIVPNGVNVSRFFNTAEKVRGRIVYAGRIAHHKHVDLLVDAFREVKKNIPKAELHIVGSGICIEDIKKRAADIKDCIIHGYVSEDEIVEIFKTAWLFVLPSEREGSGIAVMEAMSAGVPFITADYPNNASKEFAQFNCGQVVEPNENAIAKAIIELYNDEPLWKELSKNALNVAKTYDWDMVANQMEAVFEMVVKNSEK